MAVISLDKAQKYIHGFTMGHPGYCSTCDEVDEHAGCEPDAEGYTCPCCDEPTLFGFEYAFMAGMVTIGEGE